MWVRPGDQRVVGECLAGARKKAGLSQDELASKLGKPQSFVSAYERGQRRVDVLEFLRIAKILDADPQTILAAIIKRAKEPSKPARHKKAP